MEAWINPDTSRASCPECDGFGYVTEDEDCPTCHGNGVASEEAAEKFINRL